MAIASAIGVVAGCSSQPVACGGCGCADVGPPTPFDVTYEACAASDAGLAEAGDADMDASTDAGACFPSCSEACAALKPATITGFGTCVSSTQDGGATGTFSAHCEVSAPACMGRRLDGLATPSVEAEGLGAFFARAAWLEAASVGAFRRLARELRAHGAPARLIATAKACARDEIRHARLMARLAKKYGAVVPRVEIERVAIRDLESVARENAVEGCVGETFGAALARWEGERASHEDVREAMRAIAEDELRHAALGWAVAAWAERRLPRDAHARVRSARAAAAHELTSRVANPNERALATELQRTLWAA